MNPITITHAGMQAEWTGTAITIFGDHGCVCAFLPCQSLSEALALMTRNEEEPGLILPN